ncbi:hypothetical protein RAH41_09230 [Gottfriedia acidiceleris]
MNISGCANKKGETANKKGAANKMTETAFKFEVQIKKENRN